MINAQHLISIFLFMLLLFGCGNLPKPFERLTIPSNSLAQAKGDEGVQVSLTLGATDPMRRQIANAVVHGLVARNIPASLGLTGKLRYVLSGRIETGAADRASSPTRIYWQLSENDGTWFYDFTQDFDGSTWEGGLGSPKVIDEMGELTANRITNILLPEDNTLIAIKPKTTGVWLRPVKGKMAGSMEPLDRAIRYALIGAKVAVSEEHSAAQYFLEGQVVLRPVDSASQTVEIRWTITYPDGSVIGHVFQRNAVPAGTFDSTWGETAILIATAAVPGIKNVLSHTKGAAPIKSFKPDLHLETNVLSSTNWLVLPPPELSPEPDLPKSAPDQR